MDEGYSIHNIEMVHAGTAELFGGRQLKSDRIKSDCSPVRWRLEKQRWCYLLLVC